MKEINYKGMPAFKIQDVTYLFGTGGYLEVAGDLCVAYILKDSLKLRDQWFSEKNIVQELPVTDIGFKGMAEHLKISKYHDSQKRLVSYLKTIKPTL